MADKSAAGNTDSVESGEVGSGDTVVTGLPGLGGLYVKAALTGRGRGGDALPDTVLAVHDLAVDREHLAAYNRVCGFAVSDVLPATYPHVLGFPLSVALMVERTFPFPLIGLVHIRNQITVRRPIGADERLTLRVWAGALAPHERGQQFDMLTEALVDDEVVWTEASTYLRRGKSGAAVPVAPGSGALVPEPSAVPDPPAAEAAAPEIVWTIPGDTGRRYGSVSGDRNPIHLYAVTAKLFGFRSAIAHGMWVKAHAVAALEGQLPDACTVDVRFKLPVLLPATAAFTAVEGADGTWALALKDARNGKPHLAGSVAPA